MIIYLSEPSEPWLFILNKDLDNLSLGDFSQIYTYCTYILAYSSSHTGGQVLTIFITRFVKFLPKVFKSSDYFITEGSKVKFCLNTMYIRMYVLKNC